MLEDIKKIVKNDYFKFFLFALIGFYLITSLLMLLAFWDGSQRNNIILKWLAYSPFILILNIVIFTPSFLAIWYVFKKTSTIIWRILSISFFIPLLILIYFYIESFMSIETIYFSCMVGAFWLFFILPCTFILTAFIPSKLFKIKKQTLLTIFLMGIFGWLLIASIIPTAMISRIIFPKPRTWYYNPITIHRLEDYRPIINYIKNYKAKNGKYPKNVNLIKVNSKKFPYYKYQILNDQNDFTLSVSENKGSFIYCYRYCSKEELADCKAIGYNNGLIYWKIGDWIYKTYDID